MESNLLVLNATLRKTEQTQNQYIKHMNKSAKTHNFTWIHEESQPSSNHKNSLNFSTNFQCFSPFSSARFHQSSDPFPLGFRLNFRDLPRPKFLKHSWSYCRHTDKGRHASIVFTKNPKMRLLSSADSSRLTRQVFRHA